MAFEEGPPQPGCHPATYPALHPVCVCVSCGPPDYTRVIEEVYGLLGACPKVLQRVYLMGVPVLLRFWTVEENVLHRSLRVRAEGAGVVRSTLYPVHIAWERWVMSTA